MDRGIVESPARTRPTVRRRKQKQLVRMASGEEEATTTDSLLLRTVGRVVDDRDLSGMVEIVIERCVG